MGRHSKVEGTRLRPIKLFAKAKVYYGRFGKYTWHYWWYFDCDCGKRIIRRKHTVGKGEKQTKSCGCYKIEVAKKTAQKPQVKKNRFTKDQKTGNKRQVGAKKGHNSARKGLNCIFQYENRRYDGAPRMYVTDEDLNDIFAGYKEIDWEKREIRQTEILRGA